MFLTPYQLALIAGGFTILGALLGNWISHRFSGSRDRRKEFNDLTMETFASLCEHVGGTKRGTSIDTKIRLLIEPYVSPYKLKGFRKAVKNYNDAQDCMDGIYDLR